MDRMPERLLAADDPEAITCPTKTVGRRLIVTDLAGNCLPRTLSGLGIPETELGRHIAWDIGIGAVSRLMADALGAASTRPHRAAIGPPRAIREPVQADLVVVREDLVAGLTGDAEVAARHRHLLPVQQPSNELQTLIHGFTHLPGHLALPAKGPIV
jgi:predicted N-formylglutamate amidohydrolase